MKPLLLSLILFSSLVGFSQTSIYDYKLKGLNGDSINLQQFHGKLLLIVNTATDDTSKFQLNELHLLAEGYRDSGLVILAVPSNDFGNESGGHDSLISRYNNFSLYVTEKLPVTDSTRCPVYDWLCRADLNGITDNRLIGDFKKFLINKSGRLVGAFSERDSPLDAFLVESLTLNQ